MVGSIRQQSHLKFLPHIHIIMLVCSVYVCSLCSLSVTLYRSTETLSVNIIPRGMHAIFHTWTYSYVYVYVSIHAYSGASIMRIC